MIIVSALNFNPTNVSENIKEFILISPRDVDPRMVIFKQKIKINKYSK